MKSKILSLSLSELAYYVSFGFYTFLYCLDRTTFDLFLLVNADLIVDALRVACILILLLKLLTERYSVQQMFGIAAVGVVVITALYASGDWNLIMLFFFIVAGRGVSVRRMAAIALPIQFIMLLITTTFAEAGIIESVYRYRNEDGALLVRSSLGYGHPNSFGQAVLSVCCSYALLRFPKFNPIDITIYTAAAFACSFFADSRTAVFCVILIIILAFCSRTVNRRIKKRSIAVFAAAATISAVVFSYVLMVIYDPSTGWMADLNSLFSGRLRLNYEYFTDYPLTLVGRESGSVVEWLNATTVQYGPDNAYIRLLVQNGVFPTILFLALYFLTFIKFAKKGRFDVCVFGLFVFAMAAVMEAYSLTFAANYCLIGMTCVIYGWEQYELSNGDNFETDNCVKRREYLACCELKEMCDENKTTGKIFAAEHA